jgi:pimeloyl-ACP methyl ester carboxylesterase
MQFAYQFPEKISRLVLVDTGGISREVNPALRAAALPGAEYVLPLLFTPTLHDAGLKVRNFLAGIGLHGSADVEGVAEGFASLTEADARRAFVNTVRSVIDPTGQRVSAADRLYLTADIPSLIVWGDRDRIIPVSHADLAHELMPGSRLEIFPGAGHFPFNDDPDRFIRIFDEFVATTEEANLDQDHIRRMLLRKQEEDRAAAA